MAGNKTRRSDATKPDGQKPTQASILLGAQPADPPVRRPRLLVVAMGLMAIWATFLLVAAFKAAG